IAGLNSFVDAYGVGTSIASGPVVDLSLDIVEIEGERTAKRGKLSGRKRPWRCDGCGEWGVIPAEEPPTSCPRCSRDVTFRSVTWMRDGRPSRDLPAAGDVRALALAEVRAVRDTAPQEERG